MIATRLSGAARYRYRLLGQWAARTSTRVLLRRYHLPELELADLGVAAEPVREPLPDDICMPPYYGGYTHDDYSALIRIARSLGARTIVELGTAYGNTTANLCRELPRAHVYTVNAPVQAQTGSDTTFSLSESEIGRAYRRNGYGGQVTQILANTLELELGRYLPRETVDLAIVDACHDTDYVLNDFERVRPFVRPGGLVLLHDTHPSMDAHLVGSYRACMQLRHRGYDIGHLRDTWWGVWRKPE